MQTPKAMKAALSIDSMGVKIDCMNGKIDHMSGKIDNISSKPNTLSTNMAREIVKLRKNGFLQW
jgi:hypothetical protein